MNLVLYFYECMSCYMRITNHRWVCTTHTHISVEASVYELLSGRKTKTLECILQTSQQEEEDRRQKEIVADNEGNVG